eukprot:356598-Pelagomonas_calceolata.AAC.1
MLLLLLFVHSLSCWRGWGGGGRWGGRCGGTLLGIPYELCCLGQVLLGLGALLLRLLGVPMTLGAHAVGADVLWGKGEGACSCLFRGRKERCKGYVNIPRFRQQHAG